MNNIISLKNICKSFYTLNGEINVIDNINLDINKNDFIAIVGTSGCGKSTLLNIISGLDNDFKGKVESSDINVGYMLQDDALIEYYNIFDNICLGLKIKNMYNKNNIDYVNNLIKKYELDLFKDKHPSELSGGMRQRVALIRTLALKPNVLLLDEPFSALDYTTRLMVNDDVKKIIKNENITTIMVTHDVNEALRMSNKVVVLSKRPAHIINIYDLDIDHDSYDSIISDLCQENN